MNKMRETLQVKAEDGKVVLTTMYRRELGDPIEADVDHILEVPDARKLIDEMQACVSSIERETHEKTQTITSI